VADAETVGVADAEVVGVAVAVVVGVTVGVLVAALAGGSDAVQVGVTETSWSTPGGAPVPTSGIEAGMGVSWPVGSSEPEPEPEPENGENVPDAAAVNVGKPVGKSVGKPEGKPVGRPVGRGKKGGPVGRPIGVSVGVAVAVPAGQVSASSRAVTCGWPVTVTTSAAAASRFAPAAVATKAP